MFRKEDAAHRSLDSGFAYPDGGLVQRVVHALVSNAAVISGRNRLRALCALLICVMFSGFVPQPLSAATNAAPQRPASTRPVPVRRNPAVQSPAERVLGPFLAGYAKSAPPTGSHAAAKRAAHPDYAGTGGTNVNFPGFLAAPFAPLNDVLNYGAYQAYASVAGDFNNDGYPDVAIAQSNGTVATILNPGPNGKLPQGAQPTPNSSLIQPGYYIYIFWLGAADFNGDGNLDLVGEDYSNSALEVWYGNGDGTFQNPTTYPIQPTSGAKLNYVESGGVAIGDFNGDGFPDVATVELGFDVLTEQTFLNDGKGNLSAAQETDSPLTDYYSAGNPGQVSVITNGSSITGLAVLLHCYGFSSSANAGIDVVILGSNGDGSFAPVAEPSAPTLAEDEYFSLPKSTLVATNLTTKAAAQATPAVGKAKKASPAVTGATGIPTTDIVFVNGDGAVYDAPLAPQSGSYVLPAASLIAGSSSLNQGGGRYNPYAHGGARAADSTSNPPAASTIPFLDGINMADANGDGLPDLFVYSSGSTYIYLNGGDGTFNTPPAQVIGGHAAGQEPQPQDFDGSGHTSFVVLDSQQLEVGYYEGDGTGLFYGAAGVSGSRSDNGALVLDDNITVQAVGDFNGDGLLDVVAEDWSNSGQGVNNGYPDIVVGINNGKKALSNEVNNFTFTTILSASDFYNLGGAFVEPVVVPSPAGGTDVLVATRGNLYSINVNKGVAAAPVPLIFQGEVQCAPNLADVGDVNGDGTTDVVVAYGGDGSCNGSHGFPSGIFTIPQNADGTFGPAGLEAFGSSLYQVRLADFDGDGLLDVAAADLSKGSATFGLYIVPNAGPGSGSFNLGNAVEPAVNYIISDIIIGDYNSDGKQDLTLATAGLYDPASTSVVPGTWGVLQLPGHGDFTFGDGITVDTGFYPQWGAYSDFNGDGNPDLALVEYENTTDINNTSGDSIQLPSLVQILPNLGGGTFGPAVREFDGYYDDLVYHFDVPTYTFSAYAFTGNFGSGNDLLVTGTFNGAEFLNQGTDTLTLTPSATSINQGDNVTLTATIGQTIANLYTPTGTVSFYQGGTLIGSSEISGSSASITVGQLPVGADAITASYTGDGHYNAASASASVSVAQLAPDFTFTASSGSLSLTQGATGVITLSAAANSTFSGTISVTCSGAPTEATCTVSPASVTVGAGQTGVVTVVVATTAKGGKYQASNNGLWMKTAGGVSLASLLFWIVPRRRRLTGIVGMVLLAVLSLGTLTILTGCGGDSGNPGTPVGSSTLTITATAGGVSHTQTINVTIAKP